MSPRGASRVFRLRSLVALAAALSIVSGVQGLKQENQASSGVVIQGSGQLDLTQARKPLIRRIPDDSPTVSQPGVLLAQAQRAEDVEGQEEAVRLQMAEAARAVERQEALEAVVAAAEEVTHDRQMEEVAEEHLASAAHVLDEVTKSSYLPMELPETNAEVKPSPAAPRCTTCQCKFLDRHGVKSDCDSDYALRLLVTKWLDPKSEVIEFGAMYGTTSCAIATRQSNSGKLVAVEPDHRAWVTLETNRLSNKCNFTTVRGLLGQQDMKAVETNGAMKYLSIDGANKPTDADVIIPHLTMGEIQSRYSMRFNAAVIDCDGCLSTLVQQNTELFPQLDTLIVADEGESEVTELKKLAEMGNFKEVEAVDKFHVLRRNCGSIEACKEPVDKKTPLGASDPNRPKDHVQDLLGALSKSDP